MDGIEYEITYDVLLLSRVVSVVSVAVVAVANMMLPERWRAQSLKIYCEEFNPAIKLSERVLMEASTGNSSMRMMECMIGFLLRNVKTIIECLLFHSIK